tara:strand:- start:2859 stop:3611 length:753 start_codon:yes stop_codon:yes gene_type:complete
MADYQKVEINEKAPNEIEPDQQQATEVEEPQAQQERPEWLPEKFESAEALAKAYGELESKMGQGEQQEQVEEEPSKETEPTTEPNPVESLITDASVEFAENEGKLTDETYEALAKAGLSRELVDRYAAGQAAITAQEETAIKSAANGDYDAMAEWAGQSLSDSEFNAFNEAVNQGTVEQAQLAVKGLHARWQAEVGASGPKLVTGNTTGTSTMPYQSMQEVSRAMQDPRYKSGDKAYHAEVDRRLAVSNI